MTMFSGTCKLCGLALQVELDDSAHEYAGTDPLGLVAKLTCNRCFDLRERNLRITHYINDRINVLGITASDDPLRGRIRTQLSVALTRLSQVMADQARAKNWVIATDIEKFTGILVDHPDAADDTMLHFRSLCRTRAHTGLPVAAPVSLPYRDS